MRAIAGAVLLASTLAAASSRGQDASPPPAAPEGEELALAKELFRQGNELRKTGDCASAVVLYLRSRALVASSANTMNSAFCLHQLERDDEALELYEELIARFSADLTEEDRRVIAPTMAELRRHLGQLEISSNAEGVVVVDGRMRGRLPLLAPLRARPGRRVVRILADGFETFETSIEVEAGKSVAIDARLVRITRGGRLELTCPDLPEAEVSIDGATLGACPFRGTLPAGPHLVWIRKRERGSEPRRIDVVTGQTTRVSIESGALGPELSVSVEPSTAELSMHGVPLGRGSFRGALFAGPHVIKAEEPGYRAIAETVDGARGGEVVLRLRIDPAHPRWAKPRPLPVGDFSIGVDAGPLFFVATGGAPAAACDEGCSTDAPIGASVVARGGWTSRVGVGASVDVGYRFAKTGVSGRPIALHPVGLAPLEDPGTVDESSTTSLFVVGLSAHVRGRGRVAWETRLGAGFGVGAFDDERAGAFTSSSGAAFDASQRTSARINLVYVEPALRVGYGLGAGVELSLVLAGLFEIPFTPPTWDNTDIVPTSNDPAGRGDGGATFEQEPLVGHARFGLAPALGLSWTIP